MFADIKTLRNIASILKPLRASSSASKQSQPIFS
jgi:hypothetical protein